MTDFRGRAFEVVRSRTGQRIETPAEAAARRRAEYTAIMNPSAEQISKAARALLAAGKTAKGLDANDVPRDVNGRKLHPDSLAARIIAAGRSAKREPT